MLPLASRLEKAGFDTLSLQYNSFTFDLSDLFEDIDEFALKYGSFSIVAWSLGGLITRKYVSEERCGNLKEVITLGTPHRGSSIAKAVFEGLPLQLHPNAVDTLLEKHDSWDYEIPLYSIAGVKNVGLFSLIIDEVADGTVTVQETKLKGMRSHHLVKTNHTGLPLSKDVAELVKNILREH